MLIKVRFLYFVLTVLLLSWIIGFGYFISIIPRNSPANASPVDLIVVLTGGDKRIETGFDLLKKKLAPQLFITGVDTKVKRLEELESFYISLEQIDRDRVIIGQEAEDTIGNAIELKKWLTHKTAVKRILLITANYHVPRSMLIFKTILPDIEIKEYPVFPPKFNISTFYQDKITVTLLLKEYHKCLFLLCIKFKESFI